MAVRGCLARAQRKWKCEAVSGSRALLSGRGKSQDRGAFNALHAKDGGDSPRAAHAQQMSKQAAKREAIWSGSLSDLLSVRTYVLGASYCTAYSLQGLRSSKLILLVYHLYATATVLLSLIHI